MARKHKPGNPKPDSEFSNRPLVGLKELAARMRSDAARPGPVSRRSEGRKEASSSSESDSELFASAMAEVVPIPDRTQDLPPEPRLPARPTPEEIEEAEVMRELRELVDGERHISIFETDEAVEGLAEGMDPGLLRKLKRGEFSVQDHLDLHGLSREQARPVVVRFLVEAIAQGKRCVLIIHGRGHGSKDKIPVLKLALRNWLVRSGIRKVILAFSTARLCDGGAGAVYVLLRRSR